MWSLYTISVFRFLDYFLIYGSTVSHLSIFILGFFVDSFGKCQANDNETCHSYPIKSYIIDKKDFKVKTNLTHMLFQTDVWIYPQVHGDVPVREHCISILLGFVLNVWLFQAKMSNNGENSSLFFLLTNEKALVGCIQVLQEM